MENIIDERIIIKSDRNYWFVRTESGSHYEEFYEKGFIAIDWDKIDDLQNLRNGSKEDIKNIIKEIYPDDKPGYVYSQFDNFINKISIGDIVMIPNKDSKLFAFGEVLNDTFLYEGDFENCEFRKRRLVKWIKEVPRSSTDHIFYKLIFTQGTVSKITEKYSEYIDRTIHSFFIKNDQAHIVLRVSKKNKVYVPELLTMIGSTTSLIESVAFLNNESIEANDVEIKLNVQSPGPIELIFFVGVGGILLTGTVIGVYKIMKNVLNNINSVNAIIEEELLKLEEQEGGHSLSIKTNELEELINDLSKTVKSLGVNPEDEFSEGKNVDKSDEL